MNKKLWWDGSLPSGQRRGIEEFEDHIERILDEFACTYSANTGPINAYIPSNPRHYGKEDFELYNAAIAFAPPFNHNDVINAVAHVFTSLGYELLAQGEDHIHWMDKANGRYITLLFLDDGRAGLYATSGCRPTDGTTEVGQTRSIPDWKHELTPNTPQSQNHHTPKHVTRESQISALRSRKHSNPAPTIHNTPNPGTRGLGESGLNSTISKAQQSNPHPETRGLKTPVPPDQHQT